MRRCDSGSAQLINRSLVLYSFVQHLSSLSSTSKIATDRKNIFRPSARVFRFSSILRSSKLKFIWYVSAVNDKSLLWWTGNDKKYALTSVFLSRFTFAAKNHKFSGDYWTHSHKYLWNPLCESRYQTELKASSSRRDEEKNPLTWLNFFLSRVSRQHLRFVNHLIRWLYNSFWYSSAKWVRENRLVKLPLLNRSSTNTTSKGIKDKIYRNQHENMLQIAGNNLL